MKQRLATLLAVAALAIVVSMSFADTTSMSVVIPAAGVTWKPAGIPGVSVAPVEGDMAKGPSHFYLKYDAGLVTPLHHHSPDHYVTVVSGTLMLTVDGKESRLGPGSFFALVNKAPHAGRVEGKEACVMFVDARGPWDVVLEETAKK